MRLTGRELGGRGVRDPSGRRGGGGGGGGRSLIFRREMRVEEGSGKEEKYGSSEVHFFETTKLPLPYS